MQGKMPPKGDPSDPVTSDFPAELAALRAGAALAGVAFRGVSTSQHSFACLDCGRPMMPDHSVCFSDDCTRRRAEEAAKLRCAKCRAAPCTCPELTAVVKLFPQEGAPIVRAMVVDRTKRGTNVHFEAAADGTLLVRLTDA